MRISITALCGVCVILLCIQSCSKKEDIAAFVRYQEYAPFNVGKYFTFQLDSTITTAFGLGFVVRSYKVKDIVVEEMLDINSRKSFRMLRHFWDDLKQEWIPKLSYMVTPTEHRLEVVIDNQRHLSLANPISSNTSWNGNIYVNSKPYFTNSFFKDWQFSYQNMFNPYHVGALHFDSTVTVQSYDTTTLQQFDKLAIYQYAKGYQVYAKDVGKVFEDIMNWEYQVTTQTSGCLWERCTGSVCDTFAINCNSINCDSINRVAGNRIFNCSKYVANYSYQGYGVKLTLLDYN